jgi:hypothetical protein
MAVELLGSPSNDETGLVLVSREYHQRDRSALQCPALVGLALVGASLEAIEVGLHPRSQRIVQD